MLVMGVLIHICRAVPEGPRERERESIRHIGECMHTQHSANMAMVDCIAMDLGVQACAELYLESKIYFNYHRL
jgi:hypothetical protein